MAADANALVVAPPATLFADQSMGNGVCLPSRLGSLVPWSLAGSYQFCDRLARREAGNFYHAFRVLPNAQRRAMCALYAFLRLADDFSDEPAELSQKRQTLDTWRGQMAAALSGDYRHPIFPALHHTVITFDIPRQYLEAVLDGVAMDLGPVVFNRFADLEFYCYRVASAVGLACIHIWGFDSPHATLLAEKAGIAFQLTNILRDLGEDARRGRVYLPQEDLIRFGYSAEQLGQGVRNAAFQELMRFEAKRATEFYEAAQPLVELLAPPGRAVFWIMSRTYRNLLTAIERSGFDVFQRRISLSRLSKILLALRALPLRWGWA